VGDVDKRDADVTVQGAQLDLQGLAQLGIQRPERFVEQQHARPQHQSAGQRNTLLLTAGELVCLASFVAGETNQLQRLTDAPFGLGLRALLKPQAEADVVGNAEMWEEGVALEHGVDRPGLRRHRTHVDAVDAHLTSVGRLEAADEPQRGGLAASTRAQQGEELTVLDRQVDPLQHRSAVVCLGQLDQFNSSARDVVVVLTESHTHSFIASRWRQVTDRSRRTVRRAAG
jgi:hypothetical protein